MARNRKETTASFSMNKVKSVVTAQTRKKTNEVEARLFRAKIAPESNSSAEKELTKNIFKDMFKGVCKFWVSLIWVSSSQNWTMICS